MNAKPLAEAYEELKALRRQGGSNLEIQSRIGDQLRVMSDDVVRQGVPGRFAELIKKLDSIDAASVEANETTNLVRILDIRTLADRIFGDENKAETWLNRPNSSLSGQKPVDLLMDELGAAVVRETLERIDHGIFA
jgi:putative toxin-antitoxin system antitoxin component (TIGR02293 family)